MARIKAKFIADKGVANGLATLDGTGKVPSAQLPAGSSLGKSEHDTSWNGTDTSKSVSVTGVSDARNCLWQLLDNANDFERIYCTIKATSSSQVSIAVSPALPTGTYRLVGVG